MLNKTIVGLEIHKQLTNKAGLKLFCNSQSDGCMELTRQLWNGSRVVTTKYVQVSQYSNYELDQAPPKLNIEYLKLGLSIARALNATIPSKIKFQRKRILDGSIPSGFQRTAIIGQNGSFVVNGKRIEISEIRLEEDSCTRVGQGVYGILRLGVPLLEITTKPFEYQAGLALAVGKYINELINSYGVVRGIGTVRQDVNVSYGRHERVELKGVQDITNFKKIINNQALRQLGVLKNTNYKKRCTVQINSDKDIEIFGAATEFITVLRTVGQLKLADFSVIKSGSKTVVRIHKDANMSKLVRDYSEFVSKGTTGHTRKVLKNCDSHFLRYTQTIERMHDETELRPYKSNYKEIKPLYEIDRFPEDSAYRTPLLKSLNIACHYYANIPYYRVKANLDLLIKCSKISKLKTPQIILQIRKRTKITSSDYAAILKMLKNAERLTEYIDDGEFRAALTKYEKSIISENQLESVFHKIRVKNPNKNPYQIRHLVMAALANSKYNRRYLQELIINMSK